MIILDTNVISEPHRPNPSEAVIAWLDSQEPETLYITAINLGEILSGLALMPRGKRREAITTRTRSVIAEYLGPRILPFDEEAAEAYAEVLARAKAIGRPLPQSDAQIAAIARCHGFAVATRDVAPFQAAGVDVINPWAP